MDHDGILCYQSQHPSIQGINQHWRRSAHCSTSKYACFQICLQNHASSLSALSSFANLQATSSNIRQSSSSSSFSYQILSQPQWDYWGKFLSAPFPPKFIHPQFHSSLIWLAPFWMGRGGEGGGLCCCWFGHYVPFMPFDGQEGRGESSEEEEG